MSRRSGTWFADSSMRQYWKLSPLARRTTQCAALLAIAAATLWLAPTSEHAARPTVAWPLEIEGSQYVPVTWSDIPGWNEDDHLSAFTAFRVSCNPIAITAQQKPAADPKQPVS